MTEVAVTYSVADVAVEVISDQEVAVTVAPTTEVAVTVEPGGPAGPAGPGVPDGGTTGQVLAKASDDDGDTEWTTPTGGGGGAVDSVNGRTGAVTGLAEQADLTAEAATRAADDTALDGRLDVLEAISIATDAELAAEAALARNADNLTSGTVADARIPSTIARDSEVAGLISAAIDALLDGAPSALDTLNELAAAVNDDASFAATVTASLATKQPLDADLTAIAALTTTSIGRSLLAAVDVAALHTILGLGSLATVTPTGTPDGTKFLRDDGTYATPAGASFPLSNAAASGTTAQYSTNVTGDAANRVSVDAAGKHSWGDGANAADTTLARTAAAELTIVDNLIAQTFAGTAKTGTAGTGRFCGRSSGPPATGTFNTGDFTIGAVGTVCICTAGGTPGTWVEIKRGVAPGGANTPGSAVSSTIIESALLASFSSTPATMTTGFFRVWGTVLNNTGSTQTVRLRVKLNATFYLDTGTISLPTSATVRPFFVRADIYGGAGNCQMSGEVMIGGASATGTMIAPGFTLVGVGSGTDNPQGQTINAYVTHGSSSASMVTTTLGAEMWGY